MCRPLAIFYGMFIAPQIQIFRLIFDTLPWAWGAESDQALNPVKIPHNILDLNPKWGRTLPSFGNFSWDIYSPLTKKYKHQSWYLTPYCGLEVQNPTQALISVIGPSNIFDLNLKWERPLPSFGNFFIWYQFYSPLLPKKIRTSQLIFDTLLLAWDAETHPGTYVS